jgi:DNA-binding transcriptional regulator GbsR (MarR family)
MSSHAASTPQAYEREFNSGIYSMVGGQIVELSEPEQKLRRVEDGFIDAWARMAGAFAMDRTMGRIHALTYVCAESLSESVIAERLALPIDVVRMHLETLVEWGLVYENRGEYVAEQDPWAWFIRTVRARQRQELLPIRNAIESVRDAARALAESSDSASALKLRATLQRIDRFTIFVGDFAKLVDAFVTLGAGPLLKFVSMTTRFVPRRAA